jgi:hypothetical protein
MLMHHVPQIIILGGDKSNVLDRPKKALGAFWRMNKHSGGSSTWSLFCLGDKSLAESSSMYLYAEAKRLLALQLKEIAICGAGRTVFWRRSQLALNC